MLSADAVVSRVMAVVQWGFQAPVSAGRWRVVRLMASVTVRAASCSSMCPALGRWMWCAFGMVSASSRAWVAGVRMSAPPLITVVAAVTRGRVA